MPSTGQLSSYSDRLNLEGVDSSRAVTTHPAAYPNSFNNSMVSCTSPPVEISQDFIIGLVLAISSSVFIGSSFILKKKGLLKVSRSSTSRAGKGGYAYLKEWMWWAGLITMGVGEAANFTAYGFAPAILVTPLGALSVLVSAVLSSQMLNEHLNIHGKIGCVLSILGSTIIIIHAPEESILDDLMAVGRNMTSLGFLAYAVLAISLSVYLIYWVSPVHGQSNVLVYLCICSAIGSLTVVGCKGLSIAIKLTLQGQSQLYSPLSWFFLISVVLCITVQMNYLNKSLDIFNTSLVTPIYYVMFTTLTITASAILFKEWEQLTSKNIVGSICGFSTIICGVFLLHAFKDLNLGLKDLVSLTGGRGRGGGQEGGVDPSPNDVVEDGVSQSQTWRNRNESQERNESSEEELMDEDGERERFIVNTRTNQ